MPLGAAFAAMVVAGLLLAAGALVVLRTSGASPSLARRLAGPRQHRVGELLDADSLPQRPIRVTGRVRCRDPLDAGDGERLVAFHRDVEVRIGGTWRTVERLRETRSFDLWDHDGSTPLDPARAAEPIIAIPKVWRGDPSVLEEPHASAVARLVERHGPATEARAVTRSINVTDRLLVLARATRSDAGELRLEPPDGGFVISALALDDAMRLLGGPHRRRAAVGVLALAVAVALLAIGGVGAFLSAMLA